MLLWWPSDAFNVHDDLNCNHGSGVHDNRDELNNSKTYPFNCGQSYVGRNIEDEPAVCCSPWWWWSSWARSCGRSSLVSWGPQSLNISWNGRYLDRASGNVSFLKTNIPKWVQLIKKNIPRIYSDGSFLIVFMLYKVTGAYSAPVPLLDTNIYSCCRNSPHWTECLPLENVFNN